MPRRSILLAAALAALLHFPVSAQVGLEAQFQGYTFEEGLGPKAAQLLITPVAIRIPFSSTFQMDFYGAWAQGRVERQGATYELTGPIDTQVKTSWQALPFAVLSFSVSVPTGNESHNSEEAVVAAVLATDLLGFRESTWGNGVAFTSGLATAARMGGWGVGIGGSYRKANSFAPSPDQAITYQPGNETRVRLGLDRNVGAAGKLSLGATLQDFSDDQVEGRNLFHAGRRYLVDGSYAFRLGSQTWTLYGYDLRREQGSLFPLVVDATGKVVGDSTVATAKQNLVSGGLLGAIPFGSTFRLRPSFDVRVQTREEADGSEEGSGWMAAAGADLPLRLFGTYDIFPRGRYTWGKIRGPDGKDYEARGADLGITIRFGD